MLLIRKKINLLLLLGLLFSGLSSCSTIYDETQVLESGTWAQGQPYSFEFDIQDTKQLYDLFLEVEHGTTYPYQNLYCLVKTTMPDGSSREEQASLELANAKGYWLGECSGEQCTRSIPFIIKTQFTVPGTYSIELKQHSRPETLGPIKQLRLFIRKTTSS
ncbi:MAG: gliding motility lipoprotein GldH [Aureispira sp.]